MGYCCPKCGKPLSVSDVKGYPFVCLDCDENFYQFEAVWNDETGFVCPKCGNTECFTAFSVVLHGPTLIHPDGWNWFGIGFDAELPDYSIMRCEKCEHEDNWHMFEEGCAED